MEKTLIGKIPIEYWERDKDIQKFKQAYFQGNNDLAKEIINNFFEKHWELKPENIIRV